MRRRRGRGRILGEANGARSEAYAAAFRRLGSATLVAAELGVTKQAASNWYLKHGATFGLRSGS